MVANSNALTVVGNGMVPPDERQAIVQFIEQKVDLIRKNLAPKATDAEFALWIEECKFRALNPMARHIYLLPIGGRHVTQVAIDGLRLIAARTGEYAGCDDIIYDVLDADHPNRATATVYRFVQGQRVPFTASVFWKERAKQTETWRGQPYHMLGKCAMAAALRSGFPEECSGLFTDDEMVDASPYTDREIRTGPPPAPPVPRPQVGGSSRRQMREMASHMDAPIKASVQRPDPPIEVDPHAPGEWEGPASPETITDFWKQVRAAKITPEGVWAEMQSLYEHAYAAAMEKHGKPTLDFMTTEDVHDLLVALMSNPEPDDAPLFTDEELAETARKSEAARQRALTGN